MDVEQTKNNKFRGKLYTLGEESAWEDTGTGHVAIVGTDDNRRLVFRDEESGTVLHDRPLFPSGTYQLQGEGEKQTIIVWEDPESSKDWALSFQDAAGTAEIWEAISRAEQGESAKRLLPLPRLGNLGDLSRMIACVAPSQREPVAADCLSAKFVAGLREAFHTAEDLGSEEDLGALWRIAKGVFLLSSQRLTERYLRRDVFEDVLGMLEYDEGLPVDKRIAHRQVFKTRVRFGQVIAFESEDLVERIHLNYRLQYLKDIVLPRLLDDNAFVSMTQMIYGNLSVILGHLQKTPQLLECLFAQIRQKDLQSLMFLQDVCRLSKQIPPSQRQELFEKMNEHKLFDVLVPFFGDGHCEGQVDAAHPRHLAIEILLLSALNDASHLRKFLVSEGSGAGRVLLIALVRLMLTEGDQGVQGQTAEVLKSVMDPSALDNKERERCFDVFYDCGVLDELIAPLRVDAGKPETPHSCFALQLICELLAFAIVQHGYRAKVYVMRHGLVQQVARLLAANRRFLQLAPVRLLRAVVGTKDDAYHRYLVKSGIFAPLMRSFQQSARPPALGGNLLVSATLELVEKIRVENVKVLVDHLCRRHGPLLQELAPKFKVLQGLLLRHQQNQEYEKFPPTQHAAGGPVSQGGAPRGRGRSPGRDDSDDDEAYFESLEEDEGSTGGNRVQGTMPDETGGAGLPAIDGADGPSPSSGDHVAGSALKSLLGGYEDEEEEAAGGAGGAVPAEDREAVAPHAVDAVDVVEEDQGSAGGAMKRSGDAEEVGLPDSGKPAEDGEKEEAVDGHATAADATSGEKVLNHVSKRLKTSASGSP